jgi:hypothetical protein
MIEREQGEDHEKVKKKAMGQLAAVKERKGGKMVTGRKGQHR